MFICNSVQFIYGEKLFVFLENSLMFLFLLKIKCFRKQPVSSSIKLLNTVGSLGEDVTQKKRKALVYRIDLHCSNYLQVQHLQNMYLESLMSQYKDIKLDHCQVVVDYMQSERGNKINRQPEKCNQELTVQTQQNFQVR